MRKREEETPDTKEQNEEEKSREQRRRKQDRKDEGQEGKFFIPSRGLLGGAIDSSLAPMHYFLEHVIYFKYFTFFIVFSNFLHYFSRTL